MVINFRLVILGQLKAPDGVISPREYAEYAIKTGLCMSLPMHEAIDDLLIETMPQEKIEDMRGRFS